MLKAPGIPLYTMDLEHPPDYSGAAALTASITIAGTTRCYVTQVTFDPTIDYHVFLQGQRISAPIDGDANGDGVVNDLDLTVLAMHWQQSVIPCAKNGDFTGDGFVDDLDLTVLATAWPGGFGVPTESGGDVSAVPEPATLSVLSLGWLAMIGRRRR